MGLEGLGGVDLSEEVCHWGCALRFQQHMPGPVSPSLWEIPQEQEVALSYCSNDSLQASVLPARMIMDNGLNC